MREFVATRTVSGWDGALMAKTFAADLNICTEKLLSAEKSLDKNLPRLYCCARKLQVAAIFRTAGALLRHVVHGSYTPLVHHLRQHGTFAHLFCKNGAQ